MDTEPSMPPGNSQDEIPAYDRRTVTKAIATALGLLVVVGGLFLLIRAQYASPDADKHYKTVADARRHVVDFKTPRALPGAAVTEHVPVDARTARRVETALADFAGKPVFAVLWATWCRPCHAEMVELDRLYPDLARRGLVVLPILTADKAGADGARYFYRGKGIGNLPLYTDHGNAMLSAFGTGNLPVGGFISPEGKLLAVTDGLDLLQEPAQALLRVFAETGELP